MRLPVLISVPHAGLEVPDEVAAISTLSPDDIARDGDEGAAAIYAFRDQVTGFVTSRIARAFVDLNRAADDRRKDGIVKTHTCWNVPVYRQPPTEAQIETMLSRYYRPYHAELSGWADGRVRVGLDCHTMAAIGPPVGPDTGRPRPRVCLSHGDGTCPEDWMTELSAAFREAFGPDVRVNDPFRGGFITRSHAAEMPWIQIELSRAPFMSEVEKRAAVIQALSRWATTVFRRL